MKICSFGFVCDLMFVVLCIGRKFVEDVEDVGELWFGFDFDDVNCLLFVEVKIVCELKVVDDVE